MQTKLDQHDFYCIPAKVEEVAAGLGISQLGMETDVSQLSGGQRTKLLLAKLLLEQPDVLLLDEPTNYLDTVHIEWLTTYLQMYPNAFMLITHDTSFLNDVAQIIYHFEHKRLTRYPGDYKQFLQAYEMRRRQIHLEYQKQQEEINLKDIFKKIKRAPQLLDKLKAERKN